MNVVLFNIHDLVLLFTALCCMICIPMFWQLNPNNLIFNSLVVAFFLASACIPLDTLFNFGEAFRPWAIEHLPDTFFVFEYGAWIQAPLAYWMLKSILIKQFKLNRYDLLLALPFIIALTHQIVVYHTLPTDQKTTIQSSIGITSGEISIFFVQFARDTFRCVIAFYCLLLVRRYLNAAHVIGATNSRAYTGMWLNVFAIGFIAINVINVLIALFLMIHVKFNINLPFAALGLANNYLTWLFFVSVIVFYARGSLPVYSIKPIIEGLNTQVKNKTVNPVHIKALEVVMNEKKAYTDTELTQETLAEQVGVSPRTLSSIINVHYGYHFFEYVNQFRIEEAKKLLCDPECKKMTMLELMHEAGFSSKATFNGFFKKVEGVTPSEYRKQFLL